MSGQKIDVERGRHGLWYATSPDLPGLFVAEVDEASLREVLELLLVAPEKDYGI
jgi:hypothetical protein